MLRYFSKITTLVSLLALCSCGYRSSGPYLTARDAYETVQASKSISGEAEPLELKRVSSLTRIGILLPLSGEYAKIGEVLKNAAFMALYDFKMPNLVLQFYDTQGTQEGARLAAEDAVAQDVRLIVGPLFQHEVRSVRSVAHSARVKVVTFSSHPSNLGDGVYSIAPLASQQVEYMTNYACEKGFKNFALLSEDNITGDVASYAIKEASKNCGAKVTKAAFYNPRLDSSVQPAIASIVPKTVDEMEKVREEELKRLEDLRENVIAGKAVSLRVPLEEGCPEEGCRLWHPEDWTFEAKRIKEEELDQIIQDLKEKEFVRDPFEFDAILITGAGAQLRFIGSLFSYYDFPQEVKILGTAAWAEANPQRELSLLGGWFVHLPSDGFKKFSARYAKLYEEKPPRIASQAYDAVALSAVLAQSDDFSDSALTSISGFNGVDGLFRLLPNGLSERGLDVKGVEKRGFVTLLPAVQSFDKPPFITEQTYIQNYRNSDDLFKDVEETPDFKPFGENNAEENSNNVDDALTANDTNTASEAKEQPKKDFKPLFSDKPKSEEKPNTPKRETTRRREKGKSFKPIFN